MLLALGPRIDLLCPESRQGHSSCHPLCSHCHCCCCCCCCCFQCRNRRQPPVPERAPLLIFPKNGAVCCLLSSGKLYRACLVGSGFFCWYLRLLFGVGSARCVVMCCPPFELPGGESLVKSCVMFWRVLLRTFFRTLVFSFCLGDVANHRDRCRPTRRRAGSSRCKTQRLVNVYYPSNKISLRTSPTPETRSERHSCLRIIRRCRLGRGQEEQGQFIGVFYFLSNLQHKE